MRRGGGGGGKTGRRGRREEGGKGEIWEKEDKGDERGTEIMGGGRETCSNLMLIKRNARAAEAAK